MSELTYSEKIQQMDCAVCGEEGPSIGYQIKPDSNYLTVPLCNDCLNGRFNGWHGEKRMWKLLKMDELDVLNETLRKILE